jgi:hypothetical protein
MTGEELLSMLARHGRENPQLMKAEVAVWAGDRQQHVDQVEIAPAFPDKPMTGGLGLQIVTGDDPS